MAGILDAGAIVGALADDARRRCFAAIELGANSPEAVAVATGLASTEVAKALGRLLDSGLVIAWGDRSGLRVGEQVFQTAARLALKRPERSEHDHAPEEWRRVMQVYVFDGRIMKIPASMGKRKVLMDWLAQRFEPGRHYSEVEVNAIIKQHHDDSASWRRYMVEAGFLDREAGVYWRSGGTVR